jgi:hypothetical protein
MGANVFSRLQTQCDVSVASLLAGARGPARGRRPGGRVGWPVPEALGHDPGGHALAGGFRGVRPTQDERSRTTFLMANDLSLPLRRQIAQVTGADLLSGPFARC